VFGVRSVALRMRYVVLGCFGYFVFGVWLSGLVFDCWFLVLVVDI
jgi:hypothetical protein